MKAFRFSVIHAADAGAEAHGAAENEFARLDSSGAPTTGGQAFPGHAASPSAAQSAAGDVMRPAARGRQVTVRIGRTRTSVGKPAG